MTIKLETQRDLLKKQKNIKSSPGKRMDDFDMQSIINKLKSKDGEQLRLSAAEL